MIMHILYWTVGILIGIFFLSRVSRSVNGWRDFNTTFEDNVEDNKRLYLSYREFKKIYPVNEGRWFWNIPRQISWCKDPYTRCNYLWFDADEQEPRHEVVYWTSHYSHSGIRPTVYKVFLTYPAYLLARKYRKQEVSRRAKQSKMDQNSIYLKNKQIMVQSLKADIKNWEAQAEAELKASKTMMQDVLKQMQKNVR